MNTETKLNSTIGRENLMGFHFSDPETQLFHKLQLHEYFTFFDDKHLYQYHTSALHHL